MNKQFLLQAIELSRQFFEQGNFPAGAAFEKHGVLTGAELYVGLENCLMCTGVAYWAGIRDVYLPFLSLKSRAITTKLHPTSVIYQRLSTNQFFYTTFLS